MPGYYTYETRDGKRHAKFHKGTPPKGAKVAGITKKGRSFLRGKATSEKAKQISSGDWTGKSQSEKVDYLTSHPEGVNVLTSKGLVSATIKEGGKIFLNPEGIIQEKKPGVVPDVDLGVSERVVDGRRKVTVGGHEFTQYANESNTSFNKRMQDAVLRYSRVKTTEVEGELQAYQYDVDATYTKPGGEEVSGAEVIGELQKEYGKAVAIETKWFNLQSVGDELEAVYNEKLQGIDADLKRFEPTYFTESKKNKKLRAQEFKSLKEQEEYRALLWLIDEKAKIYGDKFKIKPYPYDKPEVEVSGDAIHKFVNLELDKLDEQKFEGVSKYQKPYPVAIAEGVVKASEQLFSTIEPLIPFKLPTGRETYTEYGERVSGGVGEEFSRSLVQSVATRTETSAKFLAETIMLPTSIPAGKAFNLISDWQPLPSKYTQELISQATGIKPTMPLVELTAGLGIEYWGMDPAEYAGVKLLERTVKGIKSVSAAFKKGQKYFEPEYVTVMGNVPDGYYRDQSTMVKMLLKRSEKGILFSRKYSLEATALVEPVLDILVEGKKVRKLPTVYDIASFYEVSKDLKTISKGTQLSYSITSPAYKSSFTRIIRQGADFTIGGLSYSKATISKNFTPSLKLTFDYADSKLGVDIAFKQRIKYWKPSKSVGFTSDIWAVPVSGKPGKISSTVKRFAGVSSDLTTREAVKEMFKQDPSWLKRLYTSKTKPVFTDLAEFGGEFSGGKYTVSGVISELNQEIVDFQVSKWLTGQDVVTSQAEMMVKYKGLPGTSTEAGRLAIQRREMAMITKASKGKPLKIKLLDSFKSVAGEFVTDYYKPVIVPQRGGSTLASLYTKATPKVLEKTSDLEKISRATAAVKAGGELLAKAVIKTESDLFKGTIKAGLATTVFTTKAAKAYNVRDYDAYGVSGGDFSSVRVKPSTQLKTMTRTNIKTTPGLRSSGEKVSLPDIDINFYSKSTFKSLYKPLSSPYKATKSTSRFESKVNNVVKIKPFIDISITKTKVDATEYKPTGLPLPDFTPPPPKTPRFPPIPVWGTSRKRKARPYAKATKLTRPTRYSPSFTAALIGKTTTIKPTKKLYSPLESRPIIIKKEKKKKKEKKVRRGWMKPTIKL